MAHAIDEAGGDLATAHSRGLFQRRLQVVRVYQAGQRMLHQLLQRPVEGLFPHRIQRDRHHVRMGHGEQIARQLPGAIALSGAFLNALTEGFVHLPQRLGRQLLLGDVHKHANEARTALAVEKRLAAGFHPAHAPVLEQHAIGGAELAGVATGNGAGNLLAHAFAVVRMAEPLEQRHVDRRLGSDSHHRAAALVPDERAALRFVVPHAQACRIDSQARAYLDLAQRLFGLQPAPALVDLAHRAFHRLGQEAEVLLEHVVDRAGAHHVDRMLFAEHTGQKDEGGLRREPTRFLQRLATGEAGQDEVSQDQVEFASLQGFDHTGPVIYQLSVQGVATALQRQLGKFGVVRAVLDEQDADVL